MKYVYPKWSNVKVTITLLFLSIISLSYAQVKDVSIEDLQMQEYEKDTSAGAVFLFNIGSVDLDKGDDGFRMTYTRHARIKFFDESELEWADVEIPFYFDKTGSKESVKINKAITYNLVNGEIEITKLDKKTIIEEETTGYYKQLKFAFANVKPGSVVEYEYELESPFKNRPYPWYFQSSIPVVYSEYKAAFASFWQYKALSKNYESPIIDTVYIIKDAGICFFTNRTSIQNEYQYGKAVTKMAYNDVPAFYYENQMQCKEDYISKVEFQLMKYEIPGLVEETILKTWEEVAKELYDQFDLNKKVNMPTVLEAKLENQTLSAEEKTKIILSYVQKKYKWNGKNSINAYQSSKELQESKEGNSAELNLHLIRLLRQNGVNAYPIILSTSSHGRLNYNMPFIKQFNYILPLISDDKGVFFCDATLNCAPYFLMPSKCLNGHGFLVDNAQPQFIEITDISQTKSDYNIVCNINPTMDSVTLQINLRAAGYDALSLRDFLFEKDNKAIIEKLFPTEEDVQFEYKGDIEDDDYNTPLNLTFTIKKELMVRNNKIYLNPFVCENITKNPFQSNERKYPIDFRYKSHKKTVITIITPQGYSLEASSNSETISTSDNAVKYQFMVANNGSAIQSLSDFNLINPVIKAENYQELKDLYDAMIRKQSEYFVFSKSE